VSGSGHAAQRTLPPGRRGGSSTGPGGSGGEVGVSQLAQPGQCLPLELAHPLGGDAGDPSYLVDAVPGTDAGLDFAGAELTLQGDLQLAGTGSGRGLQSGGQPLVDRHAELVAAAVAALLVRRTGARATVAHVSHPEVAGYLAAERARGAALAAEGCPQYFLLREDEVLDEGALRKFTPPARARTDDDEAEMWRLLRSGVLTHVSSDHAPSTLEQKRAGDIWNVHFGLPGLDSTLPLLLDAVARGHLAWEDVARVYAEQPARTYGLWPRKGRIGPGSDADLVLVDPGGERTLRHEDVLSKAGWTPYAGRTVRGRVVRTYLRGTPVAEEGRPLRERAGRLLRGAGATPGRD